MVKFLIWLILLVVCWPLALLALVAYPIVWLLLLPFRLVGIVVDGVFEFLGALIRLPARAIGGSRSGPDGATPGQYGKPLTPESRRRKAASRQTSVLPSVTEVLFPQ